MPSNLVLRLEELIFSSSMSARWASFNSWISYRTSSAKPCTENITQPHTNDQITVKRGQQRSPNALVTSTEFTWIIKFKVHRFLVYVLLRIKHLRGDNKSTLSCQSQRRSDISFIINKLQLYHYYIINYHSKAWGWYIFMLTKAAFI